VRELLDYLSSKNDLALFCDFDGTLVPIFPSPHDTVMSERAARALAAVVARPRTEVALVSGRPVEALMDKALGPLPAALRARVALVGNHGMERVLPGGARWEHPAATAARPAVARLGARLAEVAARDPGVVLEQKGISLSVHTRKVADDERRAALEAEVAALADGEPALERFTGKRVIEVRPRGAPHKGDGILMLLEAEGRAPATTAALFLGDDVTDEDGFRALERWGGRGVRVVDAREPPRPTAASFVVDGVEGALGLLETIAGVGS
jgi:trehalose 6-phosphate phosphatase